MEMFTDSTYTNLFSDLNKAFQVCTKELSSPDLSKERLGEIKKTISDISNEMFNSWDLSAEGKIDYANRVKSLFQGQSGLDDDLAMVEIQCKDGAISIKRSQAGRIGGVVAKVLENDQEAKEIPLKEISLKSFRHFLEIHALTDYDSSCSIYKDS